MFSILITSKIDMTEPEKDNETNCKYVTSRGIGQKLQY